MITNNGPLPIREFEYVQRSAGEFVQIAGRLREARKMPAYREGTYFLVGEIYNDQTGRFEDGALVHTPTITGQIDRECVETGTEIYIIESWDRTQRDHGDETDHPLTRVP